MSVTVSLCLNLTKRKYRRLHIFGKIRLEHQSYRTVEYLIEFPSPESLQTLPTLRCDVSRKTWRVVVALVEEGPERLSVYGYTSYTSLHHRSLGQKYSTLFVKREENTNILNIPVSLMRVLPKIPSLFSCHYRRYSLSLRSHQNRIVFFSVPSLPLLSLYMNVFYFLISLFLLGSSVLFPSTFPLCTHRPSFKKN